MDANALTGRHPSAGAYPFALLFSPIAAVLIAGVVADCQRDATDITRISPTLCGWSACIGLIAGTLCSFSDLNFAPAGIVVTAAMLMPAQHALNVARNRARLTRKREVFGFAPWQLSLVLLGAIIWALLAYGFVKFELPRLAGDPLPVGEWASVIDDQFRIAAPV